MAVQRRLRVRVNGVDHVLSPGAQLRFGRDPSTNEAVIGSARREGSEDRRVSRRAGVICFSDPQLSITNTSTSDDLQILVTDEPARPRRVEPGDTLTLVARPCSVNVAGEIRTYRLDIDIEGDLALGSEGSGGDAISAPASGPDAVPPTRFTFEVSEERRLDLAALCVPLLDRPGASTKAASYREAAKLRGITAKALERRIAALVEELRNSGSVDGLVDGGDVKQRVCEHAVRTGIVSPRDVARVREHASG